MKPPDRTAVGPTLVALAAAQLAHTFGQWAVRAYVFLDLARYAETQHHWGNDRFPQYSGSALYLVVMACLLPSVVAAPLAAALADRWSRSSALQLASVLELALAGWFVVWGGWGLVAVGLLGVGATWRAAARRAVLAAGASDDGGVVAGWDD